MRSVGWHSTSGREKEGIKERTGMGVDGDANYLQDHKAIKYGAIRTRSFDCSTIIIRMYVSYL